MWGYVDCTVILENTQLLFDDLNKFVTTLGEQLCMDALADGIDKTGAGDFVVAFHSLVIAS